LSRPVSRDHFGGASLVNLLVARSLGAAKTQLDHPEADSRLMTDVDLDRRHGGVKTVALAGGRG
jgi:hypothetical protein